MQHEERGFRLLEEWVADLRERAAQPYQRVPTGWASLDLLVEGPAAGEVHTFVGRSFTGKSLIATNIMANNPDLGIIFFSLEMPAHQVLQRLWAHIAGVSGHEVVAFTKANMLPDSLEDQVRAYKRHVIVDRAGLTLGDMSVYLRLYETWFGERPHAVIIDYLEEIAGGKQSAEGWTRTEATASALKGWAKDEQVPVWVLHQANKNVKVWEPPNEDSPKGGGFVESDVVVGIWRPGRDPELSVWEQRDMAYDVSMNVIKNRVTGRLWHELKFRQSMSLRLVELSYQEVSRFYA